MQRLAGNFLVKRVLSVFGPGGSRELYELPNGQWQFGRGRDAQVVTSMEQVGPIDDPNAREALEKWVERLKTQKAPEAVQQGMTPMIAGDNNRDRLSQALSRMPEEAIARMLIAVESIMGPIADSLKQGDQVNSHGDGFGQDQDMPAPASTAPVPFALPEGAWWANDRFPAQGYFTRTGVPDSKGVPSPQWHPTPDFDAFVENAKDEKSEIEQEMERLRLEADAKEKESGAPAGRSRTRRAAAVASK